MLQQHVVAESVGITGDYYCVRVRNRKHGDAGCHPEVNTMMTAQSQSAALHASEAAWAVSELLDNRMISSERKIAEQALRSPSQMCVSTSCATLHGLTSGNVRWTAEENAPASGYYTARCGESPILTPNLCGPAPVKPVRARVECALPMAAYPATTGTGASGDEASSSIIVS